MKIERLKRLENYKIAKLQDYKILKEGWFCQRITKLPKGWIKNSSYTEEHREDTESLRDF